MIISRRSALWYKSRSFHFWLKLFRRHGSVFRRAAAVAVPCAVLSGMLALCVHDIDEVDYLQHFDSILTRNEAWAGFQTLVGFLIVFRTTISYKRFWDGATSTHQMRAEWFDGCSALIAFTKHSKVPLDEIMRFQNKLIRLFSMLHTTALAAIEEGSADHSDYRDAAAFKFQLLDVGGIDDESLQTVRDAHSKAELIFQWIQSLIVENIRNDVLSIPPPILSRAFQEIANGMVAFHQAMEIAATPFPFPYAQTCDFLLIMHWFITPFVMSQWIIRPWWAFIFSFAQTHILWALNFTAVELENPFGSDMNDLDRNHMQCEMNQHLRLLLRPSTRKTPRLSERAIDFTEEMSQVCARSTFSSVWKRLSYAKTPEKRISVLSLRDESKAMVRLDDEPPSQPPSSAPHSFALAARASSVDYSSCKVLSMLAPSVLERREVDPCIVSASNRALNAFDTTGLEHVAAERVAVSWLAGRPAANASAAVSAGWSDAPGLEYVAHEGAGWEACPAEACAAALPRGIGIVRSYAVFGGGLADSRPVSTCLAALSRSQSCPARPQGGLPRSIRSSRPSPSLSSLSSRPRRSPPPPVRLATRAGATSEDETDGFPSALHGTAEGEDTDGDDSTGLVIDLRSLPQNTAAVMKLKAI